MPHSTDISPLARIMRRVDEASDGNASPDTIATGFPSLDKLLGGGVRRGDLVVIGGDVASGKSALALAIALRAASRDHDVAFFSGEMSVQRVMERALAIEGRASVDDIRDGRMDENARAGIGAAAVRLRDASPRVERLAPGGIASLADDLRRQLDLELAVIDSLQSLTTGARTRDEDLAVAVQELKQLAVELEVAVIVTTQLPHLPRDRKDLRPRLDDYGALGTVAQHADVVLGLFREEMYDSARGIEGATELIVNKNRNGGTGYADLYFFKKWMRFEDVLDPER
ncbi:MAG TPA: DnaB-like helicase C-terminal domain-containing protein [Gemmatimonadaceae bacterium]|nr:DnaB-like helicase C-terminal domain-containing protein [Gemmatimonadaceae bacterium]